MEGIFSFINKSPPIQQKPSKRTFPDKIYGVSQQSPSEFKLTHTLVNLDGYSWKQPPEHYLSQLRYNSVVGSSHIPTTFSSEHRKRLDHDEFCFKRKKGLLSQFLDNHAWKRRVIPLLGAERSSEGRSLRNIEYSKLKEEANLKRSSLHNIRYHYSHRKHQQHPKYKTSDITRELDNKSLIERKLRPYMSNTLRLNSIQTFQKYIIAEPPNATKSRFSNHQSYSIDRIERIDKADKAKDGVIFSFQITGKTKHKSTHQDETCEEAEKTIKERKTKILNRSLLQDSRRRRRSEVPALQKTIKQ